VSAPTVRPAQPGRAVSAAASLLERLTAAEDGGATLVALALAGVILMVGVVAVDVGALVSVRAAVQTAADMAALAALTPVDPFAPDRQGEAGRTEGRATSRAAEIAAANRAELVLCECSAVQAVVRVRRRVRLVPGGLAVMVTARARAVLGPPPTTSRPTLPPADLLRAVDEDPADRPRGVVEDPATDPAAGQTRPPAAVEQNGRRPDVSAAEADPEARP